MNRTHSVGLARRIIGTFSDLSREELKRVLPIASAYGLVLASLYLLKPARNALFLSHRGIEQLPYVLLLVAIVGAGAATAYGYLARAMRTDRLIRLTFAVLMVMLVGFRLLLPLGWGWLYYVFFVWVALYGVLTTSLIWLLANSVFTTREARRVFGFIGTGGIGGAILGGVFTGWAVDVVGTENLLLVCIGLLGASLGLLRLTPAAGEAAEARRGRRRRGADESGGLKEVLNADLMRSLALMTALIAVVAVMVDIQFNEMVDRAFDDQDAKTAFFGTFFAYLSGISFVLQLFATPILLRTAGAGVTIMILPVAMGLGSAAMFALPGLLSAAVAKGADGGFRHSIHKAASEVIFLPVPAADKKTAKLFLDTTVDASATGIGALLVVALTGPLGLGYHHVSLVAVVLVGAALALAPRMRAAYVDAFRRALEGRTIDVSALTTNLSEAAMLKAILPILSRDNPRQVLYALSLLTSAKSPAVAKAVLPLLAHGSAEVRCRALEVLRDQGARIDVESLHPLLDDSSEDVRRQAMVALIEAEGTNPERFLREQLDGSDSERQAAALGCIARSGSPFALRLLTPERVAALREQLPRTKPDQRAELAAALAAHPDVAADHLDDLDQEPLAVQQAAIEGMGRSRHPRYIEYLLDRLDDHRLRRQSRRSLALFGDPIVPAVLSELDNTHRGPRLRQALARVLEDVGTQAAADALLAHLSTGDPSVRKAILRSLSRLRQSNPDLIFTADTVFRAFVADLERYYDFERVLACLAPDPEPASEKLLRRAVGEKQQQTLEHIFLLLGLRYPVDDMAAAFQGILSPRRPVRASAIEFLENVLKSRFKPLLLPILDPPGRGIAAMGAELFPKPLANRQDALVYLLRSPDPWLTACAAYCIAPEDPEPLPTLVQAATGSDDPVVRETAETAMAKRHRADGHR